MKVEVELAPRRTAPPTCPRMGAVIRPSVALSAQAVESVDGSISPFDASLSLFPTSMMPMCRIGRLRFNPSSSADRGRPFSSSAGRAHSRRQFCFGGWDSPLLLYTLEGFLLRERAAMEGHGRGVGVAELGKVMPRVLIVSRRTVRKNKFVNFVGEYHLDLIVSYGAVPVIVPRVTGVQSLLDSFEPFHGVLLCEGEDVDPTLYIDSSEASALTPEELEEIKAAHSSDTSIDKDKDSIELQLARRCLERNIPYMGICRGSQVLNVACGGSLYQDVERELGRKSGVEVQHMDYSNYDGHRHPVTIVKGTPLHEWFADSLQDDMQLNVNSYHHQGVKRLSQRFKPMAHAPDGLVEGFYDPDVYKPEEGKFIVGLQFHPERMQHEQHGMNSDPNAPPESVFDYPGCPRAYQEFVKAVVAYKTKVERTTSGAEKTRSRLRELSPWIQKQQKELVYSFSLAKNLYEEQRKAHSVHNGNSALQALQLSSSKSQHDLNLGAEFLKVNSPLNKQQVLRLNQMGATVRNSKVFKETLELARQKESSARKWLEDMSRVEVQELHEFYKMMVDVAGKVLEQKQRQIL